MFAQETSNSMRVMRRLFSVFAALFALALLTPASAFAAQTVVSLTFDDGWSNQSAARSILAEHGMLGTFYVNSNTVGTDGFLSWAQLRTLNADGHEIAGHTLDHAALLEVSDEEAIRQICEDRQNILAEGFVLTSFAYPFGDFLPKHETMVRDCGYASGRGAYGLRRLDRVLEGDNRPYAEPLPLANPYAIRTPCCINSTVSLSTLQNYIVQAENGGGGLVALVLHQVCDDCGDSPAPSISTSTLNGLLEWLKPRAAQGTVVRTIGQVVSGDTTVPATSAVCNDLACSTGWYAEPVSVTLRASDTGSGVAMIRYTLDGSEPTVASALYTGPFAVSTTTTVKFRAWDNAGNVEPTKSQAVRIDTEAPSSAIACDGSACQSEPYGGPVSVSLSATDTGGSGVAVIRYTTDGSTPTTSSPAYTAPFAVSTTTTVKFRAWDNAGNVEATNSQLIEIAEEPPPPSDTEPPTSAIACNGSACSSGWYGASVTVTLSATDDDSGVAAIRYTLDGSEPTASSPLYTGPFTVSATTTVRFRAWDNAGNVEPTNSQLIRIDTQAPSVAITSPANGATVKGNVKISADAFDALSGVVVVRFYVNGDLHGSRTNSPYFVNWQTNKLPKGQYSIMAEAEDAAGNKSTSTIVVTVG